MNSIRLAPTRRRLPTHAEVYQDGMNLHPENKAFRQLHREAGNRGSDPCPKSIAENG